MYDAQSGSPDRRAGAFDPFHGQILPSLTVRSRTSHSHCVFGPEARDPRGTLVETYLRGRKLVLPDHVCGEALRFHPALTFGVTRAPCRVALFRDIVTNEPCGIHRTLFDRDGRKLGRRMLGRAKHAAIKLDADEDVTLGLVLGEGLETGLAAQLAGFRPVWALGLASAIAAFPVLPGIEAINILGEFDDSGANHHATKVCSARWTRAGQEVFIITPLSGGDLADIWASSCDDG